MNGFTHYTNRFVVQLVLAFTLFSLGTTLALGTPVAWLFQRQTDFQVQSLLEQANQTTQVLLENKAIQLENLNLLIAERPTLNQLILSDPDSKDLDVYLQDFLSSTSIDILLVCGTDGLIAQVGSDLGTDLCQVKILPGFMAVGDGVWMFSETALLGSSTGDHRVILGQDAGSILDEFSPQSGLVYGIFLNQRLVPTSNLDEDNPVIQLTFSEIEPGHRISLDTGTGIEHPYMVGISSAAGEAPIELVSLLDIQDYSISSRQLRNWIFIMLISICVLAAIVAVLVSRRISKPLNQLALSAAALRGGDLKTPLSAPSNVWEVNQLTNALEDARVSLKHSLDQLQKEKTWIESVLDSIVEGLLTLDERNRVTFASESVESIFGSHLGTMLGHPIDDLVNPAPGEDAFSSQLPAPHQSRRIPVIVNDSETLLSVSASEFVPPEAGNASRALVIRDVTDEERIHRLMGEFMANITHEFRTPLSALAASVELLVEQLPDLTPNEIEQLLGALNVAIVNLQALIDNLLEAASIEAGRFKVKPHPVILDTIIMDAIRTVEPISQKHDLTIRYQHKQVSICVLADQRRTCQALVNLLSNAIKYSPEGGSIEVTTLIVNDKALVEVSDQGVGVPPERRAQLFHRFAAAAADDDDSASGFGLGLSVVKAIIEAQDGEIGLRDREPVGSRFWFTLPLAKGEIG